MEGIGDFFESEVLRHAGAFGNKLVRGLGTPQKQKIAAFGSSYTGFDVHPVGAAKAAIF